MKPNIKIIIISSVAIAVVAIVLLTQSSQNVQNVSNSSSKMEETNTPTPNTDIGKYEELDPQEIKKLENSVGEPNL